MSFIQRRRVSEILWKDPTSYISQFGTSKKVEISDINDFSEGILCRRNFSLFQTVDLLFHLFAATVSRSRGCFFPCFVINHFIKNCFFFAKLSLLFQ